MILQPGETMKRTVNLTELYQMVDYGMHKVRANIFLSGANRYFSSNGDNVELTEGRLIWKQTVGVPGELTEEPSSRTFSLLTLQQDKGKYLYVRVVGEEDGIIYGCYSLGKLVADINPETHFDRGNNLWVLQLVGQKTYFRAGSASEGIFRPRAPISPPRPSRTCVSWQTARFSS